MTIPVHVLMAEDAESDAELMTSSLRTSGYEPRIIRAFTEREFRDALLLRPGVILADYHMPRFGAKRALEILDELGLDIPLIIVTGSISEEVAVECMKRGAADYLLKDRLGRLGQAVAQALQAYRMREDQRRSQRLRDAMVQELNHRVKNNLSVVLAIADQTRRSSSTIEEFMQAFYGRIMAMANVHSLLAAASWQGAGMMAIVSQTVAPFAERGSDRIRIRGPEVTIAAHAATILGIVIHELVSNAMEHGALHNDSGVVDISWRIVDPLDPEIPIRRLRLDWSESGGPTIDAEPTPGFGLTLVRGGVMHELGGDVDMTFGPQGLRYRATFPLRSDWSPSIAMERHAQMA